jgi:hypothetical protein
MLGTTGEELIGREVSRFLELEHINERVIMTLEMSSSELTVFLADKHLARIATVMPNGAPHVTPVWYLWKAPTFSSLSLTPVSKNGIFSRILGWQ